MSINMDRLRDRENKPPLSVGLVAHIWHLDILKEISHYIELFPYCSNVFITHSNQIDNESRQKIRSHFPEAKIVPVENLGQDAGALYELINNHNILDFDLICKIHTKKGFKRPAEWRKALLDGTLYSIEYISQIIHQFESDPEILIGGPRNLFLHGPSNLFGNTHNIVRLFPEIVQEFDFQNLDWGFFAGSCLWMRRPILQALSRNPIAFESSVYQADGLPAHAVERMLGMLATTMGGAILLGDTTENPPSLRRETGFPRDLPRITASMEKLFAPAESKPGGTGYRGALDLHQREPLLKGWLASDAENAPRQAIIRCGDVEIRANAGIFRQDLKDHGIHDGHHAFFANVPNALIDGVRREFILIDAQSGTEIARKSCAWNKPTRSYRNFSQFLKSSMTQPIIMRPFLEEDKRCFATMDNLVKRLSRLTMTAPTRPLVSVIMPAFNRAESLPRAISSVLSQTYKNFELVIVDDGSTDSTVAVAKQFSDSRIRIHQCLDNGGQSKARNVGISISKGDFIAYLDSDNIWAKEYLAASIGAFIDIPDADVICTGQYLHRGDDKDPFAVRYGHINFSLIENNNYIDVNSIIHKPHVAWDVNGFSEELRRYVDYDFIMKIMYSSKIYSVPVVLTHYLFDGAPNRVGRTLFRPHDMAVARERFAKSRSIRLADLDRRKLSKPVTVIIPNWQAPGEIQDCLSALTCRGKDPLLSIIVIDNGSDKPVTNHLKDWAARKIIHLIENDRNYGFSFAVNQGIALADSGADIFILNNDAMIEPGAIQMLQEAAYRLDSAGITVPRQILPSGTKTIGVHVPYADPDHSVDVNISAYHQNIENIPLYHDGGPFEINFAPFFAAYIRRQVIDDIGYLDAELGRHYRSDRIYCDLMRSVTDWKIYYVPDAQVVHRLQKSTEILRDKNAQDRDYDWMFIRNQWSPEDCASLDFKRAPWDTL